MPTVFAEDGAQIFYKDWGRGQPVIFSHGWPVNADVWDVQMDLVASHGFRGIAHDRRGHGRSSQTWGGNDMDTYAGDLAALMDTLNIHDAVLVGHSAGGGEVVRYLGRYGTSRVQKAVLRGSVTPHLLDTADNPGGAPLEVFDAIRSAVARDRSQYYRDLSETFYGSNREGSAVSQGVREAFWLMGMTVSEKAAYDCIKAFSETDLTEDCKRIDVPTLIGHGDDDQVVPLQASASKAATLIRGSTLKIYPGAPHGLTGTFEQDFNDDLLTFIRS
jgi:non-heme chloroperoxidase